MIFVVVVVDRRAGHFSQLTLLLIRAGRAFPRLQPNTAHACSAWGSDITPRRCPSAAYVRPMPLCNLYGILYSYRLVQSHARLSHSYSTFTMYIHTQLLCSVYYCSTYIVRACCRSPTLSARSIYCCRSYIVHRTHLYSTVQSTTSSIEYCISCRGSSRCRRWQIRPATRHHGRVCEMPSQQHPTTTDT